MYKHRQKKGGWNGMWGSGNRDDLTRRQGLIKKPGNAELKKWERRTVKVPAHFGK